MTLELRIGNSRWLRIPRALIEQCGFGKTVEVVVEKNRLVIAAETRSSGFPQISFDAEQRSWYSGYLPVVQNCTTMRE
jgi:antitoxin component of MazEF toxin-antitoxin module